LDLGAKAIDGIRRATKGTEFEDAAQRLIKKLAGAKEPQPDKQAEALRKVALESWSEAWVSTLVNRALLRVTKLQPITRESVMATMRSALGPMAAFGELLLDALRWLPPEEEETGRFSLPFAAAMKLK
jgi:hypothetical protein